VRTFLGPNSLLTGKNTGNIAVRRVDSFGKALKIGEITKTHNVGTRSGTGKKSCVSGNRNSLMSSMDRFSDHTPPLGRKDLPPRGGPWGTTAQRVREMRN